MADRVTSSLKIFSNLSGIYKNVDNWYDLVLFRARLKNRIEVRFKYGATFTVNNREDYDRIWTYPEVVIGINSIEYNKNYVLYNYKNKRLYFYYDNKKQLWNTLFLLLEMFRKEEYKRLNVDKKTVLDIGANIGDSSVYFALKGADHVYAFEPYPYSYDIARKNISKNKLGNKITLINAACGIERQLKIEKKYKNVCGTPLKTFQSGSKINVYSLESVVKKYNIKNGILKCDCEGGEYDIFLNASGEVLRHFEEIMVEYHHGYKNLVKKLEESGYAVSHSGPNRIDNEELGGQMYIGMIMAKRIGPP
ncbi:MAG: FkbM family methyltransferase [Candidatus Micrarchaeota archaeon]|nr:FkbM family methyltransferase [Candidatus Micrarchaeota archaeon]MDE1834225.1 FkbM family methyltransferase [Candidatus Micrarchaeota archaeon]MDE1859601.1 FkbM family methyltransferase [Candidatus Micrarchaeota archaeon]